MAFSLREDITEMLISTANVDVFLCMMCGEQLLLAECTPLLEGSFSLCAVLVHSGMSDGV